MSIRYFHNRMPTLCLNLCRPKWEQRQSQHHVPQQQQRMSGWRGNRNTIPRNTIPAPYF